MQLGPNAVVDRLWHGTSTTAAGRAMQAILESYRLLSDEQLLTEVQTVAARERTATATVVAALAEVDARTLYLAQGMSSLHAYCTEVLHMSDGAAFRRIRAARAAIRFPVILDHLADGSLSLTTVTILAPSLTDENSTALLDAARHKSRREVERQVAALHPEREDLITVVMRLRRESFERLRRAQDLLRHVVPNGDVGTIVDRALVLLIADLERKKLAQVTRPRRARKLSPGSRHIPAEIRRAVELRDRGRCAFVGAVGRCSATAGLEFHHVIPFAKGGAATIENIQLRCGAHNRFEAEREFGLRPAATKRKRPP